jgi:hypothetical protein
LVRCPSADLTHGPGHHGNGVRSPRQIVIESGNVVIAGTPDGTTGGMGTTPGHKYGR